MQELPHQFISIYGKALLGGIEVTLEDLVRAIAIDDSAHVLDHVQAVKEVLLEYDLALMPELTSGDMTTVRVLRQGQVPRKTQTEVVSEISRGESTTREFKSSLLYDRKRAAAMPETPKAELRSEDVTHSCLKTIAAFLATFGGVVHVGVNDAGECIGIEDDFCCLKDENGEKDIWELHLRNLVSSRFKDGDSVNNYVRVTFLEIDGRTVARLEVQRRRKLSFLRKKDADFRLYRRQGNRTIEVKIDEVEEFLEIRGKGVGETELT